MGKRRTRKNKFRRAEQWLTQHSWYPPLGWINLPTDLTANILQRLGPVEILETAQNVCATWRRDPARWRVIDMRYDYDNDRRRFRQFDLRRLLGLKRYFRSVCRGAVDVSNGELMAIDIEPFGDDGLLGYISDRSSHLKYLRIEHCVGISVEGLTAAVTKLPELEELHMGFSKILAQDIQTIATFCPMLKCLINNFATSWPHRVDNRCALAIARHMPNLRQLGLSANVLDDGGVKAILDGCPLLESINLRGCRNVDKDKRLGFESTIDDVRRLFYHSTADCFDQWDDKEDEYSDSSSSDYSYNYHPRSVIGSDDGSDYHNHDDDDYYNDGDDDFYRSHSKVLKDDFFKSP